MNVHPISDHTPRFIEAEQAVLGAIFQNNEAFGRVAGILKPDHFFEPIHGKIFELCGDAIQSGRAATPVTLKGKLPDDIGLEITASKYLARLMADATTVMNAPDYALVVRDAWASRRVMEVSQEASRFLTSPEADPKTAISDLLQNLDFIRAELDHHRQARQPIGACISGVLERVDAIKAGEMPIGATTGLRELDKSIGGLQPGRLVVVAGRPGMGKAQPLDAKLKRADGSWATMGEIKFGERLASVDGAPSVVTGIFDRGQREIYRVTFSDGRSTRVCADHLWQVYSCKFDGQRVLSTADLARMISKERYQNRIFIPLASGHFGHDLPLPISPWLLGVLIGNGSFLHNRVSVSTADSATLWRVQQDIGAGMRMVASGDYDYGIRAEGSQNDLLSSLRSLGLAGKRSEEKHIPEIYLTANREARIELMRGLMDTDGWVEKFGVVRFSTSSPQLARDFVELARSLGCLCSVGDRAPHYTHHGEVREGLPHFVCTVRHDDPGSLVTLIRKKRRCVREKAPRLTVRTIELVGSDEVRCISVSHTSRLYVTDDYIVTHNTIVGANIARATAAAGNGCAMFSLEMPSEEIGARILSDHAFHPHSVIFSKAIYEGNLDDRAMVRVEQAAETLARIPLIIDASPSLTVGEIGARARSAVDVLRRQGADLRVIVIDYLKFVKASERYRGQRVYEVGEITAGLKALAKDLGVCVVLLAQLNRQVEARADKRPELSDLRESGDIEADADVVLLLFREAYYLKDKSDAESLAKLAGVEDLMEIIVAKCRMGATGPVQAYCNPGASVVRDWR